MLKSEKKRKNYEKESKRLFGSLIFQYLCVCIICSVFPVVIIYKANSSIQKENRERIAEQIETITADVTKEIVENLPVLSALENNYRVENISNLTKKAYGELGMAGYYLQKEMLKKKASTTLNDIFVYFPDLEYLVTSSRAYDSDSLRMFFELYSLSKEELDGLRQKRYGMRTFNAQHNWITLKGSTSDGHEILLIADYDLRPIITEELLKNELYAFAENDIIITSNSRDLTNINNEALKECIEKKGKIKIGSEQYYLEKGDIDYTNLSLLVAIPCSTHSENLQLFRKISLILLGIELIVSVIAAYVIARAEYQPIYLISRLIPEGKDEISVKTLLKKAGNYTRKLNLENKEIKETLDDARPIIVGELLMRLQDSVDNRAVELSKKIYNIAGLSKEKEYVLFCIGILEKNEKLFSEEFQRSFTSDQAGIEYFYLNNFANDIIFERHKGFLAVEDQFYTLIAENTFVENELEKCMEALCEACEQYMGMVITVTDPQIIKESKNLAERFTVCRAEIEHNVFWGEEGDEELIPDKNYSSYVEEIRNLVNCLTLHNYDEAEKLLDEIILTHIPKNEENIMKAVCRMYGTIGIITAVIDAQTSDRLENAGQFDFNNRLYRVRTIREFREESKKILSELICFEEEYHNNSIPEVITQAKEYIDKHYQDSGLNLRMVASSLDISDSYLTRTFRNYMGVSVLEYIQMQRLEQAKILLKKESIKDTVQKVGLWDTQALIRLFKKYEGITPGMYKEHLQDL